MKKLTLFIVLALLCLPLLYNTYPPTQPVSAQDASQAKFGAEWFGEGIMYEVFVRSFRDTDGDGVGDLQGVIEGLDYIQSLGANIIWLMPIHPTITYHGYDVIDYYSVNPEYGTMEDLMQLIEEVHARDMYIIMDYIANHTSDAHPFFIDAIGNPASEFADFHNWENEDNTEWASFANTGYLPEINYNSEQARQHMIDVATFWLDPNGDGDTADGFDGLRCDVATGPPFDFWEDVRAAMVEVNPDSVLLAEAWTDAGGTLTALDLRNYLQPERFNAIFDFPTMASMVSNIDNNGDGLIAGQRSGDFLEIAVNGAANVYPEGGHLVRFASNHDTNRIMSEVEGDLDRAKAVAVWLMTAPGTPMIYYGEEIGMLGTKGTGPRVYDEYRREPMDWYASERGEDMTTWFTPSDRFNAPQDGISVEEQDSDPDSLLNLYRDLGELRNGTPALNSGTVGKIDLSSEGIDLYAMFREDADGNIYYIVINFMPDPITADFTFTSAAPFLPETVLSSGFELEGATFTIDPAGYAVLHIQTSE